MGYAKIYRETKYDFSSFTHSKFTGLKFKNSALGPDHGPFGVFAIHEMELARLYPCTKFEVSSFIYSKDTAHVPCTSETERYPCAAWCIARSGSLDPCTYHRPSR